MSRIAPKIDCSENDINRLKSIVYDELSSPDLVKKAQAVLKCIEGKENKVIAQELGVRRNTIGDWRKKYIKDGIEGLKRKKRQAKRGNAASDTRELARKESRVSVCSGSVQVAESPQEEKLCPDARYKDENGCKQEKAMWNAEIVKDRNKGTEDVKIRAEEKDPFLDPSVNNVMNIQVDICDRYGNKIQKQIQLVNGMPDINDISYESPLTLSASIGEVETGISKGLGEMAKALCEGYMDTAYKKK